MIKFLRKFILFFIPIFLFLLIPFSILKTSKENFYNINKTFEAKKKYLIGYKYNESNYKYLKYKTLIKKDSIEVLALGSSRVLQFRSKMFNHPFYNAGYTISSINDFKEFLNLISRNKLPKYLILGLDQWMFNESWDKLDTVSFDKDLFIINNSSSINNIINSFKMVYEDIFSKKITYSNLTETKYYYTPIGLNAKINLTGFRNDGSMFYGKQIGKLLNNNDTAEDFNYEDTFLRIDKGNRRFEYSDKVNVKAVKILDDLLAYCKEHGIKVVGFIPPFADKVYNRMMASNKYRYIENIFSTINPIFKKYNFEFYQFNSVKDCGSNDGETIDGFHGGEKTYIKLLIKILETNSFLNEVTDINKLKSDLNNSVNHYIVYK